MRRPGIRAAVRWGALIAAAAIVVVFLVAQRQGAVDVSYAESPTRADGVTEGSAGETSGQSVPSVEEMTAMVAANEVVRLPGSVARWDTDRVRGVRILVAPPGLSEDDQKRVRAVENATVRIIGTRVTSGVLQAVGSSLADWRAQFAVGDVTDMILALLKAENPEEFRWREPEPGEVEPVAAALRTTGLFTAQGATLREIPSNVASAFPDGRALVVALPQQPFGSPVPRYGPALEKLFPDTPVIVMYGQWIEYHGPYAEDFTRVVGASFYSQFGDLLSRSAYPQGNVLSAYLNRVTDVRYAGLFDRPLPYQPLDPLRVALPVLPWLFVACVVAFLALTARTLTRPSRRSHTGTAARRLAALTGLAVEISALTRDDPALVRGLARLTAAREALDDDLPERHVQRLLAEAADELDDAATRLPFAGYRPAELS